MHRGNVDTTEPIRMMHDDSETC